MYIVHDCIIDGDPQPTELSWWLSHAEPPGDCGFESHSRQLTFFSMTVLSALCLALLHVYMYMYVRVHVLHVYFGADSFHYLYNEELNMSIDLSRNNIAWDTDRNVRFRNPSDIEEAIKGTNMPPNWVSNISGIDWDVILSHLSIIILTYTYMYVYHYMSERVQQYNIYVLHTSATRDPVDQWYKSVWPVIGRSWVRIPAGS